MSGKKEGSMGGLSEMGNPGGIILWAPWWMGILSHVLILGWGVWEVRRYLNGGIFDPDFEVIREAWVFGFQTFPLVLLGAGVVGCILGSFSATLFGKLAWWTSHGGGLFIALGIFVLGHYMTTVEPHRMEIREVEMRSSNVSRPLTILHLSDLQSGGVGPYEERVFETIRRIQPDLVIHSGDWLQPIPPKTFSSEFPKLRQLLRRVEAPLGFFGVYGDTDGEWYGIANSELEPLEMMGVQPYLIEWEGGVIALRGLGLFQSRYAEMSRQPVREWMETVPDGAFTLLVGHAPDFILTTRDLPIELALAGHTHGGQIRFPFLGPLVIDSEVPLELSRGFHEVGEVPLNVSAGLGETHTAGLPSIRLFCPSEMTVIRVLPEAG